MTATLLDRPSDVCTGCGARAGSCGVKRWLTGRPCSDTCTHAKARL